MSNIDNVIALYLDKASRFIQDGGGMCYWAYTVLQTVDLMLSERPDMERSKMHRQLRIRHAELMVRCWDEIGKLEVQNMKDAGY